jgi:hypothetical protein
MEKNKGVAMGVAVLFILSLGVLPGPASGQVPLPPPATLLQYLDLRCYGILDQPAVNRPLRLDHLNPVFVEKGIPPEYVNVQRPEQLCVPVAKNDFFPTHYAYPYIQYADLKCYGISGPSLDLRLQLDHLNPVIAGLLGAVDHVTVKEPQQLCVPVLKEGTMPPPEVQRFIEWLDLKCYRVESDRQIDDTRIRLTHLNPLFSGLPTEETYIAGPAPTQLCVPVEKNQRTPPDAFLRHIQYADVLCYKLPGRPLDRRLWLRHLNPVLQEQGWPAEYVHVYESEELCVPVAKNQDFPPSH